MGVPSPGRGVTDDVSTGGSNVWVGVGEGRAVAAKPATAGVTAAESKPSVGVLIHSGEPGSEPVKLALMSAPR